MTGQGAVSRHRLGAYSLGFLSNRKLRVALAGAGYDIVPGPLARQIDGVAVWGDRPVAARALAAAKRRGVPPVFVEDAFLHSVTPQNSEPVIGLTLDHQAPYFDASRPSDLEDLLNAARPSDEPNLAFDAYRDLGLSKYNHARDVPDWLDRERFVLVLDQRRDDASIRLGAADERSFAQALEAAMDENPDARVLVKQHPRGGGYFTQLPDRAAKLSSGIDPVQCLKHAQGVYCVTSQLGFEAILHGQRPRVFGLPFYAGWGLSEDAQSCARRKNNLTAEALFCVVMQDYCQWFDPRDGRIVTFLEALYGLDARVRHFEMTAEVGSATGISRWKRRWMRRFLPGVPVVAKPDAARRTAHQNRQSCVVWASREPSGFRADCASSDVPLWCMEDGFVRSQGLGAALTTPGSLVVDRTGIYYDPTRASDLETLIAARTDMPDYARARAQALRAKLIAGRISKYNLGGARLVDALPDDRRRRILVPGQVEDDASVLLGGGEVRSNQALLQAVRSANPGAFLIYKPHPDVEAGFRQGKVSEATELCDLVLAEGDPIEAIDAVDEIWTMTSLMGFEALLRGRKVVCLGHPFYAGWGVTRDLGGTLDRRTARVDLDALTHASLIDYPFYFDHGQGISLSVEQFVDVVGTQSPPSVLGRVARLWRQAIGPSIR